VQSALGGHTSWGVFSLIFVAVLREGIETVLFVGAQVQQGWAGMVGAIAGLLGATMIGLLIFKGGRRINLRLFFQIMGSVLLLIVAGLVVTALRKAEAAVLGREWFLSVGADGVGFERSPTRWEVPWAAIQSVIWLYTAFIYFAGDRLWGVFSRCWGTLLEKLEILVQITVAIPNLNYVRTVETPIANSPE
jgi:FTR1 family protein